MERVWSFRICKFENAICSGIEFSNLVDYVYEHPFEEKAYTKEEIEKTYKKLIKRLYDLFKEDKTKQGEEE